MILHKVAEAFPCRLIEFSSSLMHQDLGWALWFARHKGLDPSRIKCLQLVWPDRHGRFPEDPDCIADVRPATDSGKGLRPSRPLAPVSRDKFSMRHLGAVDIIVLFVVRAPSSWKIHP
jgi:hypothetical protein